MRADHPEHNHGAVTDVAVTFGVSYKQKKCPVCDNPSGGPRLIVHGDDDQIVAIGASARFVT